MIAIPRTTEHLIHSLHTHSVHLCIYESIDWIEWVEIVLIRQFRSQGLSLVFLFVFLCIFHEEKIHNYWGEIVLHCNSYDPKSQDPIDTYAENNETEQCRVIHLYVASDWYMLRTVFKVKKLQTIRPNVYLKSPMSIVIASKHLWKHNATNNTLINRSILLAYTNCDSLNRTTLIQYLPSKIKRKPYGNVSCEKRRLCV